LLRLDTAAKVAPKAHRRDTVPVKNSTHLGDGGPEACIARVTVRTKLRDRQPLLVLRDSSLDRCSDAALSFLADFVPARCLRELTQRFGVRGDPGTQRLVVTAIVFVLDRTGMLLNRRQLPIEHLAS